METVNSKYSSWRTTGTGPGPTWARSSSWHYGSTEVVNVGSKQLVTRAEPVRGGLDATSLIHSFITLSSLD